MRDVHMYCTNGPNNDRCLTTMTGYLQLFAFYIVLITDEIVWLC